MAEGEGMSEPRRLVFAHSYWDDHGVHRPIWRDADTGLFYYFGASFCILRGPLPITAPPTEPQATANT